MGEDSEIQIQFPYIFYVKGNKEMIIRDIHRPQVLMKLVLDDIFMCFTKILNVVEN